MRYSLDEGAYPLTRAHDDDAGWDIRSRQDKTVWPCDSAIFMTGVHVEIPKGYCGLLVSRSGLYMRQGITSTGLIDSGYSGEIRVKLINHSRDPYNVRKGDRISQLVILPIAKMDMEMTDEINGGERGDGGFGSSGR